MLKARAKLEKMQNIPYHLSNREGTNNLPYLPTTCSLVLKSSYIFRQSLKIQKAKALRLSLIDSCFKDEVIELNNLLKARCVHGGDFLRLAFSKVEGVELERIH